MAEILPLVAFTLGAALMATLVATPPAVVVGWLLLRSEMRGKAVVETLVLLPLVLPPVATGLLLLRALGRRGPIGGWLHGTFDVDVVFTPGAVVIAMAVMAFPLLVLTARTAFTAVDPRLEHVATTLGASRLRVFVTISLPLAWPGLLAAMVLGLARAVGEFGATMLVAGAIPGRTETLATATWQRVQAGDDAAATRLMLASLVIALAATAVAGALARRGRG